MCHWTFEGRRIRTSVADNNFSSTRTAEYRDEIFRANQKFGSKVRDRMLLTKV